MNFSVTCDQCGSSGSSGARFCEGCGNELRQPLETVEGTEMVVVDAVSGSANGAQPLDASEFAEPALEVPLAESPPAAQAPRSSALADAPAPAIGAGPPGQPHVVVNQSLQERNVSTAVLLSQQKSAGLAVFLSFLFPGIGQFYAGSPGKGVMFIVGNVVNFLLVFVLIGFLTGFVWWVFSMIDANASVNQHNMRLLATAV